MVKELDAADVDITNLYSELFKVDLDVKRIAIKNGFYLDSQACGGLIEGLPWNLSFKIKYRIIN